MLQASRSFLLGAALGTGPLLILVSCGDDGPSAPDEPPRIEFSVEEISFGTERDRRIELTNPGTVPVAPVELIPGSVRDESGSLVAGSELRVSPSVIATLNPGTSVLLSLDLLLPDDMSEGRYRSSLDARGGAAGQVTASVPVAFDVDRVPLPPSEIQQIRIASGPRTLRQGEVGSYTVQTTEGEPVPDPRVRWSSLPAGAGLFASGGRFVPYAPGSVRLVASVGEAADTLTVDVEERGLSGSFSVVGAGVERNRHTSDLWVYGEVAYTGTWGVRDDDGTPAFGNTLFVWNVSSPENPRRVDSVQVDARVVNDVKIRQDGGLGVITHELSSDGQNGVTLLDLEDPLHPEVITRFTQGLESGIHNVWIDGDYLYLALDGGGNGLRVADISDPSSPRIVASFYAGSSFLHDVYVRDGLAFLSHWDAGLVVLDVGNGVAGGSPTNPVEVSRIRTQGGQTHNAWYWPETGYVFVGEEDNATPGVAHVVDLSDPSDPREVATFEVPGATPHNFWLDEDRSVLYAAWYGNGIRAVDVSGELLGDLSRQGREIDGLRYEGPGCGGNGTCAWAPQLHEGLVYVSDMNHGLVVLAPPE